MHQQQIDLLKAAIERELPKPWTAWPGGYPNEVEAALVDAVLSIRAAYGNSPASGVRGAVSRYRKWVDGGRLDDLARLANFTPDRPAEVLGNHQKTSGVLKAAAIVEAANNLLAAGVTCAADLDPETHRRAYTRVHGLGGVTWEYLTMLLGHSGIKADTWVTRWVSEAVGATQLSNRDAHDLLAEAARELGIGSNDPEVPGLTQLDHAIWNAARAR